MKTQNASCIYQTAPKIKKMLQKKNCLTDTLDMQALVCYKQISHAVCQQNILKEKNKDSARGMSI